MQQLNNQPLENQAKDMTTYLFKLMDRMARLAG
jgi:hypothetical protein